MFNIWWVVSEFYRLRKCGLHTISCLHFVFAIERNMLSVGNAATTSRRACLFIHLSSSGEMESSLLAATDKN